MKLAKLVGAGALVLATMQMGAGAAYAQVASSVPSAKNPTVAIGSDGMAESAPDLAIIGAGLFTNDPSSEAAAERNNREFAKIVEVAKKYKIAPEDLQTAGVNVGPNYVYPPGGGEKLDGYTARNTLKITMRDMAQIGSLIADLTAAGANNIGGPAFGLEDNEALRNKAREKAFDNAQARALTYARKAGFRSVRLLTINESAGDIGYAYAAEAAMDASSSIQGIMPAEKARAPIETGLVSETVFANFLFEMVP